MMKKVTPVLIVEAIEPVLPLWEALGFTKTAEVPHGDSLGFVMLQNGAVELMYQTFASVRDDEAKVLDGRAIGAAALFIEVADLEDVMKRLPAELERLAERRKTFYGATETIVRDAAGNVITFAEFGADES
jgi:hypothetical protein